MTNMSMSPEQIEREIADQRRKLAATLSEVSERLAQDRIISEAAGLVSEYGGKVGRSMLSAARANPVTAVAAGAGIALAGYGALRYLTQRSETRLRAEADIGPLRSLSSKVAENVDSEALARVLKLRLQVLEAQRDLEAKTRAAGRTTVLGMHPAVAGVGAAVAGIAIALLRRNPDKLEELRKAAADMADDVEAAVTTGAYKAKAQAEEIGAGVVDAAAQFVNPDNVPNGHSKSFF